MNVYYITKNHNSIKAIEDYIEIIKSSLDKYEVRGSHFLIPNHINCIIDEATDKNFISEIQNIKKEYPGTIIVYFFTEFVTTFSLKGKQIMTFNYFERSKIFENYLIDKIIIKNDLKFPKIKKFLNQINNFLHKINNFLNRSEKFLYNLLFSIYKNKYLNSSLKVIWAYLLEKNLKRIKDFLKTVYIRVISVWFRFISIRFLKISNFFYKVLNKIYKISYKKAKNIYINFLGKNNHYFFFLKYMFSRYNGFLEIIDCIDIFLITHPIQKEQINQLLLKKDNIFMCYDKIPEIKPSENIEINISGENTNYRSNILKQLINSKVDNRNNFEKFMKSKFYLKKNFGWYSLNPPKNEKWPYSSPMRYLLSIRNNEIPISLDSFSFDNFFDDLKLDKQITDLQKLNYKEYMFDIKKINKQIRSFNNENTKNIKEFLEYIDSLKRGFQKEV